MSHSLAICGDTNMREFEEVDVVNEYDGKLWCVWSIVPDEVKENCMFSWYRNYFEVGAEERSRFDKVFHGNKVKCAEIKVFDESVSAEKYHFLSDHRGICVTLEIH